MRELKFRIWDNHTNRFVTCVYETNKDCYLFIGRSGYVTAFNCYGEEIDFQDGRFTIQQYTGLKDKNGKEIYEGDILMPDTIAGIWPEQRNGVLVKDIRQPFANAHLFKIVGNIFKNPELLK